MARRNKPRWVDLMSRRNKPRLLPIGPVSEGTLKSEDLLPIFLDVAEDLRLTGDEWATKCVINGNFQSNYEGHRREAKLEGADFDADGTIEELRQGDIGDLVGILNAHCPDFTYFGAHEGDGASFGCWPSSEVPFHGPATDEIGKGDELPVINGRRSHLVADYWLVVNDHGNATLYRKKRCGKGGYCWRKLWSVV